MTVGFIQFAHMQIRMEWGLAERQLQMSDLRGTLRGDRGYMINLILQQTHGLQQVNYKVLIEVIAFGIHALFHQREDEDGET